MCIIAYKPKGEKLPNRKTLQNCYDNNPDGAGFMYDYKGEVRIEKGFMTSESFFTALEKLERKIDIKSISLVLHFRIGTQGANDKKNCHPFPISNNSIDLCATKISAHVGLAHNGIIPTFSKALEKHFSDTHLFVRDFASLIMKTPQYYLDEGIVKALDVIAQSKLAILSNDGYVQLIGSFEQHEGIFYSNSTYKENYSNLYRSAGYGAMYGDWGDEWYTDDGEEGRYKHLMPVEEGMWFIDEDGMPFEITEYDTYFLDEEGALFFDDYESGDMLFVADNVGLRTPEGAPVQYNPDKCCYFF